jgi:hypothetical protein
VYLDIFDGVESSFKSTDDHQKNDRSGAYKNHQA